MHGSCAGNIKQIFIMFGFVSSAVCIGEDDFIKFQAFGHPDGSDRDAVLKAGAFGSEEMDFKFFGKQIINRRGFGVCFCDDSKRSTVCRHRRQAVHRGAPPALRSQYQEYIWQTS